MEEIEIGEDGIIKQVAITSSGIKGAFKVGDQIPAATAVFFSGARGDMRIITREVQSDENENSYSYTGYSYSYFDRQGQYNGFRYVALEECKWITVCIKTEFDGAILNCVNTMDNNLIASVRVPNTSGKWMELKAPLVGTFSGKNELKIELEKVPDNGKVEFDWFRFA